MSSWIAATAFLATNVDDLFLLTLWFVKRSRFTTVLLGQLLGFSAILFLGLVGYWGLRLLPESAVHWLGLAPIAIGIKQLLSSLQTDSQVQVESAWSVAIITFANGADHLAVYIPLFGKLAPWQVGAVAAIFYLLPALNARQTRKLERGKKSSRDLVPPQMIPACAWKYIAIS